MLSATPAESRQHAYHVIAITARRAAAAMVRAVEKPVMPSRPVLRQIARYAVIGLGFMLLFVLGPLEMLRASEGGNSNAIAISAR